jgi:hypothetical protein
LLFGHDTLDIVGLAPDPVAKPTVGLDRKAGDDSIDGTLFELSAALRSLTLVMNVIIDRIGVRHESLFCKGGVGLTSDLSQAYFAKDAFNRRKQAETPGKGQKRHAAAADTLNRSRFLHANRFPPPKRSIS